MVVNSTRSMIDDPRDGASKAMMSYTQVQPYVRMSSEICLGCNHPLESLLEAGHNPERMGVGAPIRQEARRAPDATIRAYAKIAMLLAAMCGEFLKRHSQVCAFVVWSFDQTTRNHIQATRQAQGVDAK